MNAQAAALPRVTFETTECTRCGGTGHYSFNLIHGTTCFKCGGRKVQLSRRGAAACKAWDALMAAMETPVDQVKVGDKVAYEPRRWAIVTGLGTGAAKYNGQPSTDIVLGNPGRVICALPGQTVKVWSDQVYLAAVAKIEKLAGATVTPRDQG